MFFGDKLGAWYGCLGRGTITIRYVSGFADPGDKLYRIAWNNIWELRCQVYGKDSLMETSGDKMRKRITVIMVVRELA